MKSRSRALMAALASSTALTACTPTPEEELRDYIIRQMEASLADTSWQERQAAGAAIYKRLLEHNGKAHAALQGTETVEQAIESALAYRKDGQQLQQDWDGH